MTIRKKITITGQVQGVGFRPAVYRIAARLGLTGLVYNDTTGVTIELQGAGPKVDKFLPLLKSTEKPPAADIKSCKAETIDTVAEDSEFRIQSSRSQGQPNSQVTADMAVCDQCIEEMNDPLNFRYRYPFINCTNCGPRYSIIKTIPYDRPNTTMSQFRMCERCQSQYTDVLDRRFHAQPVACPACGPRIWLNDNTCSEINTQRDETIAQAARMLREGKIVAIKGIGGFHLAVDALNESAVQRLRHRKLRDEKPFAMMAESVEKIALYANVSERAEELLKNFQAPIVILGKKPQNQIAPSVAPGVDTFGFMLCYAPLHYLLFEQCPEVLVMTSANLSDEPLICKNDQALDLLGDVADAFLMHDREIYRQVDDSVVHFVADEPVVLRRSRGYVPNPIIMAAECGEDILALGGDLKNTFCLARNDQLILSEHIGDLADGRVYRHYLDSIEHLRKLFEVEPQTVVCDLHPNYLSTQYAKSLENVDIIQVQHHWGHIASVLAENGLAGPAIGLACDGTGYGTDGAIWGCECLIGDLSDFERFGHLEYYPLCGANKAAKEAIRPTIALLHQAYGSEFKPADFRWLLDKIEPDRKKQDVIFQQISRNVNTAPTSSLGRVFDAVAAMVGLGSYNHFEAQLPMALESSTADDVEESYDFELSAPAGEPQQIILRKMIREMIADITEDCPAEVIASRFHNTVANALVEMVQRARSKTDINTVALSGGVFCNRYLANRLIILLKKKGFSVLFNRLVPSNDGGLALGQAAIAAYRSSNQVFSPVNKGKG